MTAPPARVGIVGPILGHHPGWVVSQGERLAEQLAGDGLAVKTTSGRIRRLPRALDTAKTMRSWKGAVDVVVVMVFSGPAFAMADLASRSARALGVPVALWLHGGNLPTFSERHPRWVRRVFERAEVLVAPTTYLQSVGEAWGRPCVVIDNLSPDEPAPFERRGRREPRLLWMRTFHPLYRPELAVEVLGELVRRHPEALLTMAGQDRGSLESTRALVRQNGLDEHVRFPGFLGHDQKHEAFREHDIFLNTTRADNAPVSLIEAAAHGVSIVSTSVGGIPALFPDGEAALLADSAQGLCAAVTRLLDEPGLADALAHAAHDRSMDCTWERVGPRWHSLLTEVTAGA